MSCYTNCWTVALLLPFWRIRSLTLSLLQTIIYKQLIEMHSTEEITLNLILSLLFVRDFPNTNLKRAQINIKYKIKRITKTKNYVQTLHHQHLNLDCIKNMPVAEWKLSIKQGSNNNISERKVLYIMHCLFYCNLSCRFLNIMANKL